MKRNILYIILSIATPQLYTSCYVDLDLETHRPDPSIVVNSIVSTDQYAAVHVGKTTFYTDTYRPIAPIKDAKVVMTINQGEPQTLSWSSHNPDNPNSEGVYLSNYTAKAGDTIRLDITDKNGNHAWAKDIMPRKTLIERVDTTISQKADSYNREINYRITFTDAPNEKNYYFLHIIPLGSGGYDFDFGKEDVFRQNGHGLDQLSDENTLNGRYGMAFSDELINGKTYTLRVSETLYHSNFEYRNERIIRLYSITESYYRYLLGIFNKDEDSFEEEMVKAGLAEPSPHYTNIQGGVGIFGLMQIDEKTINIGSETEREDRYDYYKD